MRGRAIRREQMRIAKARIQRRLPLYDLPATPRWIGLFAHTPKTCSCWMCGNQRKFRGERTRQELLSERTLVLD